MRIIVANYRYFLAGGPEKYMFKFIDIAQTHGIECIPFSVQYNRNQESAYSQYFALPRGSADEIQYEQIKMTPKTIWRMLNCSIYNFDAKKRLKKLIRETKPDCVYIIHEINSLSPSIIDACKEEGVRVVHRISDFFLVCANRELLCDGEICEKCIDGQYCTALKKRCVKNSLPATLIRLAAMKLYKMNRIFQKVDAWVVPSSFTRSMICRQGIDEKRFYHIPTFIDSTKVTPCYENDGYALFLGRLSHEKGAIFAIQAMRELRDLPIRLKITGIPDPLADKECIDYIEKERLANIDFVGFQTGSELEKLIRNAMCVVCPAIWYENMPNTVVEAYAYGKPVVASSLGSLAEIVEDGRTGMLFEPKNSVELAEKIRLMYNNPSLVREMGMNARKTCEDKYDPELHFNKVLSLLKGESSETMAD